MSQPVRTSSQDSDGIRKRVCKACDRCRLKKSKCDGSHPCSRCKADNAICVFGERKKSHDKVYPKGYVEMLEQQQSQLVTALQEMYKRSQAGQEWSGPTLAEVNGHPLTHDILTALNLLETRNDGSGEVEGFEEDCQKLQSKLLADGAGYMQRRGSFSSDSEHSQVGHGHAHIASISTSNLPNASVFKENFSFPSNSPSPLPQSPAVRQRQSFPPTQPSPLQQSSPVPANDPHLFQPDWALPDMSTPAQLMKSRFALQTPEINQSLPDVDNMFSNNQFDISYDQSFFPVTSYPQQLSGAFASNLPNMQDFVLDPMDLELNRFIQVSI